MRPVPIPDDRIWADPHGQPLTRRTLTRVAVTLALLTLTILPASPAAASSLPCTNATPWDLKGAFPNGSVMEARACVVYSSAVDELAGRTEWRLRHGGTPIAGAVWDMDTSDGAGGNCYRANLSRFEDGALITYNNYCTDLSGSYILTETPLDCDHTYATADYYGWGGEIRVYNPETGTKSGWKVHSNIHSTWSIPC